MTDGRLLARLEAALAERLAPPPAPPAIRFGVVLDAPAGGPLTVDVGGTTVPNVPYDARYTPHVGDTVVVDVSTISPYVRGLLVG